MKTNNLDRKSVAKLDKGGRKVSCGNCGFRFARIDSGYEERDVDETHTRVDFRVYVEFGLTMI